MVTTLPNSAPGPSSIQSGSIRPQPSRPDAPQPQRAAPRPVYAAAATHDPSDVDAAARRLDVLLEKDANGQPRKDVPRRGFYLNIVV